MLLEIQEKVKEKIEQLGWIVEDKGEYLIVNESEIPYLFIECVEDCTKEISQEDQVFFTEANGIHQNSFFALTDGQQTKVYSFGFGRPIYLDGIQTIEEFLSLPLEQFGLEDMYRRIYEIAFLQQERIIDRYIEDALISETTELKWQQQYVELINALFYESYYPTGRVLPISEIIDVGLVYMTSKNASGGGYEGLHRKFIAKCLNSEEVPFVLSVFATAKTVNDPKYGNRKGSTQLNIAMLNTPNSSYNLQVDLNKYVEAHSDKYTIWHNGIRSRMKKEYVIQMVSETADFLLDGDRIHLGKFPLNETISEDEFSYFIENIISYSYCRHLADLKYR